MRSTPRLIVLMAVALAMSASCTLSRGDTPPELLRKKVTFNDDNYRVVKSNARGVASCPYVFYINLDWSVLFSGLPATPGGVGFTFSDPNLYEQAMADFHEKNPMTGSQLMINVIEEFDTSGFLFLYRVVELTITADIVEFIDEAE